MIGFLILGRVMIKIRVRVGVTFNVRVYRWSCCRRSKCRTFGKIIECSFLRGCRKTSFSTNRKEWLIQEYEGGGGSSMGLTKLYPK